MIGTKGVKGSCDHQVISKRISDDHPIAMWLKIRKMFMRVQCVGSLMVSDNVSNIMPEMLIRLPLFLITYVSFIFQRITSNSNLNNQSTDQ